MGDSTSMPCSSFVSCETYPHSLSQRFAATLSFLKIGSAMTASCPICTANSLKSVIPGQRASRTRRSTSHSKCGTRSGCCLCNAHNTRSSEVISTISISVFAHYINQAYLALPMAPASLWSAAHIRHSAPDSEVYWQVLAHERGLPTRPPGRLLHSRGKCLPQRQRTVPHHVLPIHSHLKLPWALESYPQTS